MEQPTTVTTAEPKIKKTADRTAYMRDYMAVYRYSNLEKCRAQERAKYHRNKERKNTEEEKKKRAERLVLNALEKYPEILNSI
jgi:predicted ABC-class ATPase